MTCPTCHGAGRVSHPNPAWTPATPREATGSMGVHGRPIRACEGCMGANRKHIEKLGVAEGVA